MGSKPTIRDVAKRAGVSIATVSYVLNDSDEVISPEVQARVRRAVRALNYHRAAAAVSLATQRSRNVALVLAPTHSDVTNPFYSFVIQGIIREAMSRDYNVLFSYVESHYRGPEDLPKFVREANVAGVLFVGHIVPAMLCDIRQAGIAVVAVDHHPRVRDVASVQIDNAGGGRLAAEHLLGLGHRGLAFVGQVKEIVSIAQRAEGFRRALVGAAAAKAHGEIVRCDALTFAEGQLRARDLLARDPRVTALCCANDEVAAGALRAAHALGRRVPEELSIVGFDDILMSNYLDPPLTTVRVEKEALGMRAATRLLEAVEGRPADTKTEVVPVDLVLRSSTAPPRARARKAGALLGRAGDERRRA